MDSFDIDLEDLDLKSVDIKPATPSNTPFQFQPAQPNLTISSSNNDPMPSSNFMSSDKNIDFGLDLLINKKKIRPDAEVVKLGASASGNPSPTPHATFNSILNDNNMNHSSSGFNSSGPTSGFPERVNLDDTELLQKSLFDDNITNIDLDKELNTMDLNDISKPAPTMNGPSLPNFGAPSANTTTSYPAPPPAYGGMAGGSSMGGYGSINTGGITGNYTAMSFEEIQQKKFDLLCKFERLRDKGVKLPKNFSMSSSLEEMELEYKRIIEHRQLDNSVKLQKKMLLSFVSGVEMLNGKFDPFDLHLDGWSESVNESIDNSEYDTIFEELYYKYKDTVNMAPELKLAGMVAMSGFWYHITQNMAKNFMPNIMNNVMKQNPDLMNHFQQATMNTMRQSNPGFAQFASSMSAGGPPKYNPMTGPPFSNPRDAPPRGQTNINQTDDIDALIDSMGN